MSEILVVTCPSGKQNAHLLPLLYNKGKFKLRLAAHSQASLEKLSQQYPDAEVVQADTTVLAHCQELLQGATSVFHVGASFHSREKEMGFNMVDAAVAESKREGNVFQHFVYSSVLGTQHRRLMQHEMKSEVEERLYISALAIKWTILQPSNFMDAFPVRMLASQDKPSMEFIFNADMKNSLIALRDLGEVAAKVLIEREPHFFALYPLTSTMPISSREMAKAIGAQIGKDVDVRYGSVENGAELALSYLFGHVAGGPENRYAGAQGGAQRANEGDLRPDIVRDEAERLILFSNRRGLVGNPGIMRWLLGREPTSIHEWVKLQLEG